MRRRSAASASRAREKAFSLTSMRSHAAVQSDAGTVGGRFSSLLSCMTFLLIRKGLRSLRLGRRLFLGHRADPADDFGPAAAHVAIGGLVPRQDEARMDDAQTRPAIDFLQRE